MIIAILLGVLTGTVIAALFGWLVDLAIYAGAILFCIFKKFVKFVLKKASTLASSMKGRLCSPVPFP